jgi:hypothetical protein
MRVNWARIKRTPKAPARIRSARVRPSMGFVIALPRCRTSFPCLCRSRRRDGLYRPGTQSLRSSVLDFGIRHQDVPLSVAEPSRLLAGPAILKGNDFFVMTIFLSKWRGHLLAIMRFFLDEYVREEHGRIGRRSSRRHLQEKNASTPTSRNPNRTRLVTEKHYHKNG